MDISLFLARLLGFYLIISSLGFLKNRALLRTFVHDISGRPYIFLTLGLFSVLFGLFLVLLHNHWVLDWTLLITLLAWLILLRGILHVLFPQIPAKMSSRISDRFEHYIIASSLGFLLIGAYLVYKGYYP